MKVKNSPNPMPETVAAAMARAVARWRSASSSPGVGSRLISTIAGSASTIPTTASAAGRSPSTMPATVGTTADMTADTGATTLIGPWAIAQ